MNSSIWGSVSGLLDTAKQWGNQLMSYLGIFVSKYPIWIIVVLIVMFISKGKILQLHVGGKSR